jgi:hypothetical protein
MNNVVARRAYFDRPSTTLALPAEAIPCYWETASAKNKNASQRHSEKKGCPKRGQPFYV